MYKKYLVLLVSLIACSSSAFPSNTPPSFAGMKLDDANSIDRTIKYYTKIQTEVYSKSADTKAEAMPDLKLNNTIITTYRHPLLDIGIATPLKEILQNAETCNIQDINLSPKTEFVAAQLSAFCFYSANGSPAWILTPKDWQVRIAVEGADGNSIIIFTPSQQTSKAPTEWESYVSIPACLGCIAAEAALFYPELRALAKEYGVNNFSTDVPIRMVRLDSGSVQYVYHKPAAAYQTYGIIYVPIKNNDLSMDALEITLPDNLYKERGAIINYFNNIK